MQTLTLNRDAKRALAFIRGNEEKMREQSTRATYLWYLASQYPKPVTLKELGDELDMHKSQVSRVTQGLHKLDMHGEPGLDLIEVYFDLENPRLKLVQLNNKGLKIVQDLLKGFCH